ncbi:MULTISPECIES: hypothetical protein [Comamonas]|jgi:hypothetical protein|uniref:hypothetical protein n=1 Tax=Comamonas TaxID=283 RepID=UPI0006225BEA|nr:MULTISPECIES: hypothetical protein [Comamonas]KKI11818.1 hypothetical protein XA67_22585 [Comamonas thiooxydans]TYK72090.1 hypothetical protein FSY45_22470 [Comamonas sp. Z1]
MANKFYPKGAQKLLSGAINFSADTIKAVLVPAAYVYSDTHEFLSDLGAVVGAAVELQNKVVTGGVFDADDISFGAVAAGSTVKAIALFKDTGSAATSPLLAYYDVVTGFPFSTNGSEVSTPWSDGPAKILSLV